MVQCMHMRRYGSMHAHVHMFVLACAGGLFLHHTFPMLHGDAAWSGSYHIAKSGCSRALHSTTQRRVRCEVLCAH
eukprot:345483-Chlamydomonas_euryale.AAC.1